MSWVLLLSTSPEHRWDVAEKEVSSVWASADSPWWEIYSAFNAHEPNDILCASFNELKFGVTHKLAIQATRSISILRLSYFVVSTYVRERSPRSQHKTYTVGVHDSYMENSHIRVLMQFPNIQYSKAYYFIWVIPSFSSNFIYCPFEYRTERHKICLYCLSLLSLLLYLVQMLG